MRNRAREESERARRGEAVDVRRGRNRPWRPGAGSTAAAIKGGRWFRTQRRSVERSQMTSEGDVRGVLTVRRFGVVGKEGRNEGRNKQGKAKHSSLPGTPILAF